MQNKIKKQKEAGKQAKEIVVTRTLTLKYKRIDRVHFATHWVVDVEWTQRLQCFTTWSKAWV